MFPSTPAPRLSHMWGTVRTVTSAILVSVPPDIDPRRRIEHLDQLWQRHGRVFWVLHSIWALGAGVVVLWLAHERYAFLPWVVGCLLVTWVSTLFFSRPTTAPADDAWSARFGRSLASYLTRVMYQHTLFFLLPFYAYSVMWRSWNVVFLIVLAVLAVLACLDLVFDRWIRESPVFGLVFFGSVAFGALNLLLPVGLEVRPDVATPIAAVVALITAAPLAGRGRARGRGPWLRVAGAGVALLVVAVGFPWLVPPVPLRLERVTFAKGLDRTTLEPTDVIAGEVASKSLRGELAVIATVFAPSNVPARVALDWYLDRTLVRSSREVEIVAHVGGFRFWDSLRPEAGTLAPGAYRVVLRTADHRVFGAAGVRIR